MHQSVRTPIEHPRIVKPAGRNMLRYCALLLFCGWGSAMAGSTDATPETNRGAQIFKHTCSVCHGDKGAGAMWGKLQPPARNFTSPESAAKLTRERMINAVAYGRAGTAMQPFSSQLSNSDIAAVVDYIRETFMANAGISDMSLPMPLGLKGDRIRGSSLYQLNCSACHGPSGNGKGPRAYFINPPPRNFLLNTSRRWLNRPILFQIITDGSLGTEMPAWGKVLNNQEIADIAEFVFRRYINPGQLDKGSGNSKK